MNVVTATNVIAPKPSVDWMNALRSDMVTFDGPETPLADCLADEEWQGRHSMHCIYRVELSAIVNPSLKALDDVVKPLGWRCIAGGHRASPSALACLATYEGPGVRPKIMCAIDGGEMAKVLACAEQLNELPEIKGHPENCYNLRVLRLPELGIEAFWLKCEKTSMTDLIVPYGLSFDTAGTIDLGVGKPLMQNRAYKVADFLKAIRPAAKRLLDHTGRAITRRRRKLLTPV